MDAKTKGSKPGWLTLSRKQGEAVTLLKAATGGYTSFGTVKVNEIRGNRVTLDFLFKDEIRILRAELEVEEVA